MSDYIEKRRQLWYPVLDVLVVRLAGFVLEPLAPLGCFLNQLVVGRRLRSLAFTDRALVADHSWRHRARTLLEHADIRPATADAFLRHRRPGERLGRYSEGPSNAQLVEAAKSIHLPVKSMNASRFPTRTMRCPAVIPKTKRRPIVMHMVFPRMVV
jgi:hypothetical protein